MAIRNHLSLVCAVVLAFTSPAAVLVASPIMERDDVQTQTVVWIDTDPSVAPGGHEVDDGLALIQAFHSKELVVRGVSVVFGNAELQVALPIAEEIVERFGPKNLQVFPGAASAEQRGQESLASRAIVSALQKEALTILALGPLTNIATVLQQHPEIESRITRIVAVAGRRPGQHFTIGHRATKPFRDFNFELDPEAFEVLLASKTPLVLAPWELSSQVWITASDLEQLTSSNQELEWVYEPALDWLKLWQERFGVNGFNPFDTLALGLITSPALLTCEELPAEIRSLADDTADEHHAVGRKKPYLVVSRHVRSARSVQYCFRVRPEFKNDLLRRLQRSNDSHGE